MSVEAKWNVDRVKLSSLDRLHYDDITFRSVLTAARVEKV